MGDQLSADLQSLRINREPAPPRNRGPWVAVIVVAVLVAAGAAGGQALMPAVSARVFKTEVDVTEIRMVSPAAASVRVTSTGFVVPQVRSRVGARLTGRVAAVLVREGDRVKAGDVLVRLESAEQKNALGVARARLAASKARAVVASAAVAEIRTQYERQMELVKAGAVGRQAAQDLEGRIHALEAAVPAAEADSAAVAAEIAQLEANLRDCTVVSPMNGTVSAKPVEVGEVVGPTMPTVVELTDMGSLVVETDVPEARLSAVKMGGPAEIVLDAYPTRRLRGSVSGVVPRVNRAKATVVVKVSFDDPTDGVLPDMSARVSFMETRVDDDAIKELPRLFVPAAAITERDGEKVVFRVVDGKARRERIRLGSAMEGGFELQQGPSEGTRIISKPPQDVMDGYPVKEKNK